MLAAALDFINMGWAVFPLVRGKKKPLSKHGVSEATTDEKTIREWWTRWPDANIGLACGLTSGIFVLDIDVKDGKKGIESLAMLEIEIGILPLTVESKTGSGGRHLLFKMPEGRHVGNKVNFRPGLDIRGTGGYVVAPPSYSAEFECRYMWIIEGRVIAEAPLALLDIIAPRTAVALAPSFVPPRPPASLNGVAERARAYLATCEPATQGGGGHGSLLWAAGAMTVGFNLDDATACALLWAEYNPRCSPPWDQSDPAQVKDFERKVTESKKISTKAPGHLLEQSESTRPIDITEIFGKCSVEEDEEEEISDAEIEDHYTALLRDLPSIEKSLKTGGTIEEILKYIQARSMVPQPYLALGAAIAAFGTLIGRKVETINGGRSNFYIIGCAASGAGKESARRCLKSLFMESGLGIPGDSDSFIGPEEWASDVGLLAVVSACPSVLFLIDEIGKFFDVLKRSSGAAYLANITGTLLRLFTESNSIYTGKAYADVKRTISIPQPNVSVYGTTTPIALYPGLPVEALSDGFLARHLLFNSTENSPDRQEILADPVSRRLKDDLIYWGRMVENGCTGVHSTAMRVESTPGAKAAIRDADAYARERMQEHEYPEIWSRLVEHIDKLSLVHACSLSREPVIDVDSVEWARVVATRCILDLLMNCRRHLQQSNRAADYHKIRDIIEASGSLGITPRALAKKIYGIGRHKSDRLGIVEDLITFEWIVAASTTSKSNNKVLKYYGVKSAPKRKKKKEIKR